VMQLCRSLTVAKATTNDASQSGDLVHMALGRTQCGDPKTATVAPTRKLALSVVPAA
jgi:hypothetical protein